MISAAAVFPGFCVLSRIARFLTAGQQVAAATAAAAIAVAATTSRTYQLARDAYNNINSFVKCDNNNFYFFRLFLS
jgi:hypothetical protein